MGRLVVISFLDLQTNPTTGYELLICYGMPDMVTNVNFLGENSGTTVGSIYPQYAYDRNNLYMHKVSDKKFWGNTCYVALE